MEVSLMSSPPAEMELTNFFSSVLSLEKRYATRGFDLEFMMSKLSSISSTLTNPMKGNSQNMMVSSQIKKKSMLHRWCRQVNEEVLTVIIGSKGPKISSFIINELCGTSNKIVGAIFLQWCKNTL